MAIVYEFDNVTVGTTELSLVSGNTTLQSVDGFAHRDLFIVGASLTTSDLFEIRIYGSPTNTHAQVQNGVAIPMRGPNATLVLPFIRMAYKFDMTIKKVSGTDRAFSWSIAEA